MGAIGHDNEVDRQAVGGPRLGRPGDGHQHSSGSNQACGPLPDVAADDIENQMDFADVFEGVVVEVDELLRAEVERLLTVGGALRVIASHAPIPRAISRSASPSNRCSARAPAVRPAWCNWSPHG